MIPLYMMNMLFWSKQLQFYDYYNYQTAALKWRARPQRGVTWPQFKLQPHKCPRPQKHECMRVFAPHSSQDSHAILTSLLDPCGIHGRRADSALTMSKL